MTISDEEELNHLLNEFFGVGSPIYQYCIHYKIKFHRKLRAKLKNGDELEYVDETGATVKLSEDDIYEINAIPSFRAYMQNELGPRLQFSLDITKYSREIISKIVTFNTNAPGVLHPDHYWMIMAPIRYL